MAVIELGEVQARFADIIWEHEPVSSGDLVKDMQGAAQLEEADDLYGAPQALRERALREQ